MIGFRGNGIFSRSKASVFNLPQRSTATLGVFARKESLCAFAQKKRIVLKWATLLVGLALASTAYAAVSSPGVYVTFQAQHIAPLDNSQMTIHLTNTNTVPLTGIAFTTNAYSAGLSNYNPARNSVTNTCGGTVTATTASNTLQLSGGTIPAATSSGSGECDISSGIATSSQAVLVSTVQTGSISTTTSGAQANLTGATGTLVVGAADVALTSYTTDVRNPNIGDTVHLALTVRNYGPTNATGVVVTDSLPYGLTLSAATPPTGTSFDAATGQWTVGSLALNGQATLNLTAKLSQPGTLGTPAAPVSSVATITSEGQFDSQLGNNKLGVDLGAFGDASFLGTSGNVQLDLRATTYSPSVGSPVGLTLIATNFGPDPISGVQIQEQAPQNLLTLGGATPSQGTYDNTSGIWTLPQTIQPGSSASLVLATTYLSADPNGYSQFAYQIAQDQHNPNAQAGEVSINLDANRNPLNGILEDTQITLVTDNAAPHAGDTVTLTALLKNNGSNTATGVAVSDSLPAGLTLVSASTSQGTYDTSTGTWTVGNVVGTQSLTIKATVNSTAAITDTATISQQSSGDEIHANDTSSVTLNGGQALPDVVIGLSHDNDFLQGQAGASYRLVVTNNGQLPTNGNLSVSSTLPPSLIAQAIAGDGWTCSQPAGPCARSDQLAAGSSYPTIVLTVNVAANAPGSVTTTTVVSGGGETNTANDSASDATTIVTTPVITTPSSLTATVDSVFSQTFAASGGTGSFHWQVSAGSIPSWATLNSNTGVLSGSPTNMVGSPFNFTLQAVDTDGNAATKAFTLTVNPFGSLVITTSSPLPTARINTAYSQTFAAYGGTGTFTGWAVIAGALPSWAILNPTSGVLSGTPPTNAASQSTFTVQVTDSGGTKAQKAFTLFVSSGAITITTASPLPVANVGVPYSVTFSATGGTGTFANWSLPVGGGTLPGWLTLNASSGTLSGTPPDATSSPINFTLQVTDSAGATATKTFELDINGGSSSSLTITTPSPLPNAIVGTAYSQTFSYTGGSGAGVAWYVSAAGGLPTWATLDGNSGTLSGTPPNAVGSPFTFTVIVDDNSTGNTASKQFTLTVTGSGPVTITTASPLPVATVGTAYSQVFAASGGTASYTNWAITAGSLPSWATLNAATGVLSGTPTSTSGSPFNFTVQVTDSAGSRATKAFTLSVNASTSITISTTSPLPPATVNVGYGQTFAATGGSGQNYLWSLAAGTLPAWATLDANSGLLSGRPTNTVGSPFSFTLRVTDSAGTTATKQFSLTVNAASSLTITTTSPLPVAVVTQAYSQIFSASGGNGANFSWSATGLPSWATLNATTGELTGTPTNTLGSPFSFTVQVQDNAAGLIASKNFSLSVIASESMTITTASPLPSATVNSSYSQTFSASGGSGIFSNWSVTSGSLPSWATLNAATGILSGTPTSTLGSPFNFTLQVTDSIGTTATKAFALSVTSSGALSITTPSPLPAATVNSACTQTFAASGGTGSYTTWSVTAGALPAWASLNATTGLLSGTPTSTAGSPFNFTLQVTDSAGAMASKAFTLTVTASGTLTITTVSPLTSATVNSAYTQTFAATGGTGSYTTWATIAGALPSWASLNAITGVLSGTPTSTVGSPFNFTLQVTDSAGTTATKAFTLSVNPSGSLSITTPSPLHSAMVNAAYSQSFVASGGTGSFTNWSVTAGALPPWASLSATTGVFSGTPTSTAGSPFNFTVQVTDSAGTTAAKAFVLSVMASGSLVISTTSPLPPATVNSTYSQTFAATGGTGTFVNWAVTTGALPAWATLNSSTGTLAGTPTTTVGSPFNFTIQVTDSGGSSATKAFSLTVNASASLGITTTSPLPAATVNSPYSQTFAASGGNGVNLTWSATGLPPWATLNSTTGVLTGTPPNSIGSPLSFTIQVVDSAAGLSATKQFSLAINPASSLSVTTNSPLPTATVNVPYSQSFSASGGTGSFTTWSIIAGALPSWATLNAATGALTGTPSNTLGSPFNFTVQVTDSAGTTASKAFALTVNSSGALSITTVSPLTAATVNTSYSQTFAAAGGTGSFTNWAVAAGTLPSWASLNAATGVLSGTPSSTAGSPFAFTIQVTDSSGATATKVFQLTVNASGSLTVTTTSPLPAATVSLAYTQTFTASGGTGVVSNWTVTAGALPTWATLNATTGTLSGTPPNILGSPFSFTVQVTDSAGTTAIKAFVLTVNPSESMTITTASPLPSATVNSSYSQTFSASGGSGVFSNWSVTSGSLPSWATLNAATGVLSGTPTSMVGSPFNFTLQVTDSIGTTATKAFSLSVTSSGSLAITTTSPLPAAMVNTAYTQTFTASGGTGSFTNWAVTAGALPAWASLNATTGLLSGTPTSTTGSPFSFTLQVTDSAGATASKAFTLTVNASGSSTLAPIAIGDGMAVNAGGTVSLINGQALSVLANDLNPNVGVFGGQMVASVVSQPTHGTLVTFNANGAVTYKNNSADPAKTDAFQYKACDALTPTLCSTATVTVTILPVGTPLPTIYLPEAVNDAATVHAGTSVSKLSNGDTSVLDNDFDPNAGGTLTASEVGTPPSDGALQFNPAGESSGAFIYANNGSGTLDGFYYEACDSLYGACSLGQVTITIIPTGRTLPTVLLPIAVDDQIEVKPNGSATVLVGGGTSVLWNDTDPNNTSNDNSTLQAFLIGSGPSHGTLLFNVSAMGDGTFSYQNNGDGATQDGFDYQSCDILYGMCDSAHVSIEISSNAVLNRLPTANPDAIAVSSGGSANRLLSGATSLLANDTDPDAGETATLEAFVLGSGTAHGTIVVNSDGTFTYQNNAQDSATTDSFEYEACDIHGGCAASTVQITIGSTTGPAPTLSCQLPTQIYLAANQPASDGTSNSISIDVSKLFAPPTGNILNYAVSGLPSPVGINATTGLLSATLSTTTTAGDFTAILKATASPAGTSATENVRFEILSVADHIYRNGFDLASQACQ